MTIAVITGTRRDTRKGAVSSWLDEVQPRIVIMGDASGVDAEAKAWCLETGVVPVVCFAPWAIKRRAAGPIRNFAIAQIASAMSMFVVSTDPVVCAAFPDADSIGTHDCKRQLEERGFRVEIL